LNLDRVKAVATMSNDAHLAFKEYAKTIARLDIKNRIGELEVARRKWAAVKARSPYDDAQAKSYAVALKIEIEALASRLKAMPGDDKVYPPPAVWGVLSGFPSGPKVEFPDPFKPEKVPSVLEDPHKVWIHQLDAAPLQRPHNPHVRFGVPTAEEHEDLDGYTSPTIPDGTMMGTGDLVDRHTFFPAALSQFALTPDTIAQRGEAERAALASAGGGSSSGAAPGSSSRFAQVPPPPSLAAFNLPPVPSLLEQSAVIRKHQASTASHSSSTTPISAVTPTAPSAVPRMHQQQRQPHTLDSIAPPLYPPSMSFTPASAFPQAGRVSPPPMPDLPAPPDFSLVPGI